MDEAESPGERTLEEMIGKTVRRVWVGGDYLSLEFEGGLSVQIEAEADTLQYLIDGEAV